MIFAADEVKAGLRKIADAFPDTGSGVEASMSWLTVIVDRAVAAVTEGPPYPDGSGFMRSAAAHILKDAAQSVLHRSAVTRAFSQVPQ